MHVLPALVEDLLDVVGRPYDGVDHVIWTTYMKHRSTPARVITPSPPWV